MNLRKAAPPPLPPASCPIDAAFDGNCLWLPPQQPGGQPRIIELPQKADAAAKPAPKDWLHRSVRLALLPPLVELEQRRLPKIPAAQLLAAAEDGLLWQQLFPNTDAADRLLGWSRQPSSKNRQPGDKSHRPSGKNQAEGGGEVGGDEGDRLFAAFGRHPDVAVISTALHRAGVRHSTLQLVIPTCPHPWWHRQAADTAIRCGRPPVLFNRWSTRRIRALMVAIAACLLAALTLTFIAHWRHIPDPQAAAVSATQMQQQLTAQQRRNGDLQRQWQGLVQLHRRLLQVHSRIDEQNLRLRALAGAMPRGLHLQRLILDDERLSLSANGHRQGFYAQLADNWKTAGAVLHLESVRKTEDGNFVFSAVLRSSGQGGE